MDDSGVTFTQIGFDSGCESPLPIQIVATEIHVWGLVLDLEDSELARASSVLSGDEQARSNRFLSKEHGRRYVAAYAGLRSVLSRYCAASPQELVIETKLAGKPFLRDFPRVGFNLTHSHGRALIAVSKDREVGIDLERVRREVDVAALAKRFLSVKDQAFIESGGTEHRHERFLQTWVAREAVFKAEGKGIAFPLHHDHLALTGDGTAGCLVLGAGGSQGEVRPVRFLSLEPGWIGAVAADGNEWDVIYRS